MVATKTVRIRSLTAASLTLAVCLTACSSHDAGSEAETGTTSSQTIVIGTRNVAASLDPALADDNPSDSYNDAVYERLVTYSPTQKKYVPQLATSWTATANSSVYTFDLRKGVKFQDGSTLTAAGVIASLQRTERIGKGSAFLLDGISKYQALGTHRLRITLKTSDAAFPDKMSQIFIMSGKAAKAHPKESAWFGKHSAGSGPYQLQKWVPNNEIDLTRFNGYWRGWQGTHANRYELKVVDAATQVLQLRQGTIDLADSITFQDAKQMKSQTGEFTVYQNGGLPFYLPFNLDSPKLQNVKVREAISKAIPYKQVINKIMLGFGKSLAGPVPSWMDDHNDSLQAPSQDIAGARKIMAGLGYTKAHPLKLNMLYFNGLDAERVMATVVQASLKEIGVSLQVQGAPWATLVAQVSDKSRRPDLGIVAMSSPTYGPGPLLTSSFDPQREGSWTYWGYHDNNTVTLLRKAQVEPDVSKQQQMLQKVQSSLVDQYAAVWLTTYPDVIVAAKDVKGLQIDGLDRGFDYYQVHK